MLFDDSNRDDYLAGPPRMPLDDAGGIIDGGGKPKIKSLKERINAWWLTVSPSGTAERATDVGEDAGEDADEIEYFYKMTKEEWLARVAIALILGLLAIVMLAPIIFAPSSANTGRKPSITVITPGISSSSRTPLIPAEPTQIAFRNNWNPEVDYSYNVEHYNFMADEPVNIDSPQIDESEALPAENEIANGENLSEQLDDTDQTDDSTATADVLMDSYYFDISYPQLHGTKLSNEEAINQKIRDAAMYTANHYYLMPDAQILETADIWHGENHNVQRSSIVKGFITYNTKYVLSIVLTDAYKFTYWDYNLNGGKMRNIKDDAMYANKRRLCAVNVDLRTGEAYTQFTDLFYADEDFARYYIDLAISLNGNSELLSSASDYSLVRTMAGFSESESCVVYLNAGELCIAWCYGTGWVSVGFRYTSDPELQSVKNDSTFWELVS